MEYMSEIGLSGFKLATQQFTLGNLGGAATFCDGVRLEQGKVKLHCTNGAVAKINPDYIDYGLINKEVNNNDFCLNSAIDAFTADQENDIERCTDSLDKDAIDAYIKK